VGKPSGALCKGGGIGAKKPGGGGLGVGGEGELYGGFRRQPGKRQRGGNQKTSLRNGKERKVRKRRKLGCNGGEKEKKTK